MAGVGAGAIPLGHDLAGRTIPFYRGTSLIKNDRPPAYRGTSLIRNTPGWAGFGAGALPFTLGYYLAGRALPPRRLNLRLHLAYRGASLIRKRPPLGPYRTGVSRHKKTEVKKPYRISPPRFLNLRKRGPTGFSGFLKKLRKRGPTGFSGFLIN